MSQYRHLKDHSYYSDLYDRHTIDECKQLDGVFDDRPFPPLEGREILPEEATRLRKVFNELHLYFLKGERYAKKADTVKEWMDNDERKDQKLDNAREPQDVRCLGCSSRNMHCISRDLMTYKSGSEAVVFLFECNHCQKRRAFWESGEEWEYKAKCPKCQSDFVDETKREGLLLTTVYTCSGCGYTETDTLDLGKEEEKVDPNFEADRKKYCLSEKEGAEYVTQRASIKASVDEMKDQEKNKEVYEAVAKIQKLTVMDLQKLLEPLLTAAGYLKLEFEKPDLQKDVLLGFSVQESKSDRSERESIYDLQKLIKKTLEPTNWRLMSDGVTYHLGFLQGRLRGLEGEEKLKELLESEQKKKGLGK